MANLPPGLLLAATAIAAVGLLLGWRARLMVGVLFLGILTLHLRDPITQQRGDALLRVMLFWSLFLPLDRHWSVRRQNQDPLLATGPAPAAFVLQLLTVYAFSMLTKLNPTWLGEGSGVHLALHLDQLVRPLGVAVREYPAITQALTWGTMAVEVLVPTLVLLSARPGIRLATIGLAIGLHLGFGSMLRLGTFEFIPIACWLALLPSVVWSRRDRESGQPMGRWATPKAVTVVLVPVMALCAWINLGSLMPGLRPQHDIRVVAAAVGLDQRWTMFAPRPTAHDGWWIARAVYPDGSERDLLRGAASLDWGPPANRSAQLPSQHWRKYFLELWYPWRRHYRPALLRWFCNGHQLPANTAAAPPLPERVELWFTLEESQWPGGPKPVIPLLMEHRWCTADTTLPPPMPQPVIPGRLPQP